MPVSRSLRLKLPLLNSAVLCLAIGAVSWLAYREIQQVLRDAASDRLRNVATQMAALLDDSARRSGGESVSIVPDSIVRALLRDPSTANRARLDSVLGARVAGMEPFVGVSIWNARQERVFAFTRPMTGASELEDAQPEALIARSRNAGAAGPAMSAARATRARDAAVALRETWIAPFRRLDTTVVGDVVVRLRDASGEAAGYMVASSLLLASRQSAEQITRLIGAQATLLVGNARGDLWFDLSDPRPLPGAQPPVDSLAPAIDAAGTALVGVATPLTAAPWAVWVRVPEATVLSPAHDFLLGIARIALLLLVVATAVGWMLSHRMTAPLIALTGAARRIAGGDYAARVPVSGGDEVSSLSSSFNRMAEEVESSSHARDAHARELESANEELRESELRYRQLVDLLPDAVLAHRGARVLVANRAAATLFGAASPDVLERCSVLDLVMPGDRDDASARIREVEESGRSIPLTARQMRRIDGTALPVETASTPITMDGAAAVMTILRDVSEQRRIAQRLQQAEKMEAVGRLAGGVAHDFNNLLTVITSYSEMLLAEMPRQGPEAADVGEILAASHRAAALTRQLLAFSRQQILHPEVLEINHVVANMERMLRRLIPANVRMTTSLLPAAGRVHADQGQLEQVLMNLALNARDAMPDGGELSIDTSVTQLDTEDDNLFPGVAAGQYVVLTVSDNGMGMSAEEKSRMFEPFFTTKDQGRGTGLGLATVYGIVKQSGGHVTVYSETGKGTVIHVYLPRVDSPISRRSGNHQAVGMNAGTETIVLVEDDVAVREATRRVLERAGYTVTTTTTAREAISLARRADEGMDMLLTDMVMPDMNGEELARSVRSARPHVKVVYMSGYTQNAALRQSVLEPGVAFIQKPFTSERLTRKLRELLDERSVRHVL